MLRIDSNTSIEFGAVPNKPTQLTDSFRGLQHGLAKLETRYSPKHVTINRVLLETFVVKSATWAMLKIEGKEPQMEESCYVVYVKVGKNKSRDQHIIKVERQTVSTTDRSGSMRVYLDNIRTL